MYTIRKPAPKTAWGSIGAPEGEWPWSTGLFPQWLSAVAQKLTDSERSHLNKYNFSISLALAHYFSSASELMPLIVLTLWQKALLRDEALLCTVSCLPWLLECCMHRLNV